MEERARQVLKRALRGMLFVYGSLAAFGLLGADRLIFLPHPPSYRDGPDVLKLRTRSGATISARYLEHPTAKFTLLLSHGNAEDLGDLAWWLSWLRDLGVNVLAYDYEGYGTSEGAPSESHAYDDIDAAYDYLTRERGVKPEAILAYGRSLGGGPSVDLASRRPIGGLLLESTFTSTFRVMTRVTLFPGDRFVNLDKMPRVRCPLLVMHGTADSLIPIRHGRELFAAHPGPKWALWADGAGHADVPSASGYEKAIREFLRRLGER